MPQFDVHRLQDSGHYVVDCQSDLTDYFSTRLVVPLVPPSDTTRPLPRLTPIFAIDGADLVMATHLAAAVPKTVLGKVVTSLAAHHGRITAAFDVLITGY